MNDRTYRVAQPTHTKNSLTITTKPQGIGGIGKVTNSARYGQVQVQNTSAQSASISDKNKQAPRSSYRVGVMTSTNMASDR